MKISMGEYLVSCVAAETLIDESTLMENPYFIEVAKETIKKYPDINDVIKHLVDWLNENY
tara:strand:- start:1607 stop:1786 length:180 start_codon:yes stop_codon:yes gene_type:complete